MNNNWVRIRRALARFRSVPPSEAFVRQVMVRVEEARSPSVAGWRAAWDQLAVYIPEWLYPELGAALAALLLLVFYSLQGSPVSTEVLLLDRMPQRERWVDVANGSNWTGGWNALTEEG